MASLFVDQDELLRAQAAVPIYYLLFKTALSKRAAKKVTRDAIIKFNKKVADNRFAAAKHLVDADFELLEYDRMSQQGTNDSSSIRERVRIILDRLGVPK